MALPRVSPSECCILHPQPTRCPSIWIEDQHEPEILVPFLQKPEEQIAVGWRSGGSSEERLCSWSCEPASLHIRALLVIHELHFFLKSLWPTQKEWALEWYSQRKGMIELQGVGGQKMTIFKSACCLLWSEHATPLDSVLFFTYRNLTHMAQLKSCGKRRNMGIGWKS